jgi:hypothetical protein
MPQLPSATTTVTTTAGALAAGTDLVCIFSPCAEGADLVPRLYGSAAAIHAEKGYCQGVDYAALHAQGTRKSILFVGMPIETPGAISREDTSGNSDSCVTTVTAGVDGVLDEHDGVLTVIQGGTIGTDPIILGLSLDGGTRTKRVRLGTGTTYTDPHFGFSISFAAGDLTAGETIHTWHGSAPTSDSADWATARTNLAAQLRQFRSIMLCEDVATDTIANAFNTQLEAYETANERFIFGRCAVYDRTPLAEMSHTSVRMTGAPSITFAEVGLSGDTITRSSGSWIADGFAVGDVITVSGAVASAGANNVTGAIASLSALVITLDTTDLVAEGPITGVSVVGVPGLVFDESSETIVRNRGSWLTDGFRVGDVITVAGTSGGTNDGDDFVVTVVTALTMTLTAGNVDADETIGSDDVTITAGQTMAEFLAETEAAFEDVDDAPRIRLARGRGRVQSPFTGWFLRRPPSWAASVREYQHDLHIAPWRKEDGPTGFDLEDADGNTVEHDDRIDGGASSLGRFTAFRSYANGPAGAFLAQDPSRASEGSVLVYGHNQAVVNLACTTVQAVTENIIGRSLVLNDDGTATSDSLGTIEAEVNAALARALLQDARGEGRRASRAVWTASTDDDLSVPDAVLTGVLDLVLNGTVHSVATTVRVS